MARPCKECDTDGVPEHKWRPTPYPGPRCSTHYRAKRKADKTRAHARRTETTFGLNAEEYWSIYAAQGGRCAICQRATGATKRLAVDHDHDVCLDHPTNQGCRRCVRGLTCSTCNYIVLGRYDVAALQRAIDYLNNPPARRVLWPDEFDDTD